MAYEVLARKYRSRTFDEIVGQAAIATTLKNAVESGRIHHGYLFTGTRGVGKTSMARILAKSLNCFNTEGPTPAPCCECESCLAITEGGDLDVVEIDAASNTGVDNIRELRSNAAFRPARARFKVYIIDEVHMLSTGAFNALLKTLEEPPEHVKFVLATTEVHKVPATIQSRCQRFDFRSISPADIAGHLQHILECEEITADDLVIRRVARLANGSMRDALSLLDQLLSYGTKALTAELIEDLLPSAHDEVIHQLLAAVSRNEAGEALLCVERSLTAGHTPERLCDAIVEYLRALMLLAVCGADTDLVDVSGSARDQLVEQSAEFDAATYVYMIGLMEEVRRQVKSSSAPRPLIDAAVVRLALSSAFSDIADLLGRLDGGSVARTAGAGAKKKDDRSVTSTPRAARRQEEPAAASSPRIAVETAPRAPAAATRPPTSSVTTAEKNKLMERPLVKRALELTNGTITEIKKRGQPADGGEPVEDVAANPPSEE